MYFVDTEIWRKTYFLPIVTAVLSIISLYIIDISTCRTVLGRSRQSKKGEKVKQLKFALRLEREMEESRFVQLESIATE